jgi:hypothetical protein
MTNPVDFQVNGLSLASALGLTLTSDTTWRAEVKTRQSPITIPGQHGALNVGLPVYESGQVVANAWALAANQAALETAINQFIALCAAPTVTLTRVSGGLTQSAVVRLVSINHPNFVPGSASRIVIALSIPGVFFRSAVATSPDLAYSGNLTNIEIAILSGSTAPIGDAVLRVTGPRTNPYVTDPSTGTGIYWAGTVPASQYLYLCANPVSARLSTSSSAWTSGGTDVSGAVSFPAAGRLQLWPVVQSATVRKVLLSATGTGGTAASKLAVRAQGSYL